MVLENPTTRKLGTKSLPSFFIWLFGLKNVGFKNDWLPFSNPYYPTSATNVFPLIEQGFMVNPQPLDAKGTIEVIL